MCRQQEALVIQGAMNAPPKATAPNKKPLWHVVHKEWLDQWQRFIHAGGDHPGACRD